VEVTVSGNICFTFSLQETVDENSSTSAVQAKMDLKG
jgi:hypothetical protein